MIVTNLLKKKNLIKAGKIESLVLVIKVEFQVFQVLVEVDISVEYLLVTTILILVVLIIELKREIRLILIMTPLNLRRLK